MSQIIKGDELMLFKGNKSLAYATSHTLSISGNAMSTASKDHGYWDASQIGNISWEVTSENLYTEDDYDALFDAMISKQPIDVVFAKASNYDANGLTTTGGTVEAWTAGAGYKGKAVITSLEANAPTGENATYSVTLTGSGALTKTSVGG